MEDKTPFHEQQREILFVIKGKERKRKRNLC